MIFLLIGVVTALITTAISLFIFFIHEVANEEYHYWALLAFVVLGVFAAVSVGKISELSSKIDKKPIIISTKTPPQIDTTITISNGVADTTYTYHIIRK